MDNPVLFEKIQFIVSYDLMGGVPYEEMSIINQIRFNKQCRRLFEACQLNPSDELYIDDRINSLKNG